jgi:hypothetical protein
MAVVKSKSCFLNILHGSSVVTEAMGSSGSSSGVTRGTYNSSGARPCFLRASAFRPRGLVVNVMEV